MSFYDINSRATDLGRQARGTLLNGLSWLYPSATSTTDENQQSPYYPATKSTETVSSTGKNQSDILKQDEKSFLDWQESSNNPLKLATSGGYDFGPSSYSDQYNEALNKANALADAATQNGVNALKSVNLDQQQQNAISQLARNIGYQTQQNLRSTGSSMASRGLAGSGVASNALAEAVAGGNRDLASGTNDLANTFTGYKTDMAKAIADLFGQQANNLSGQATTNASNIANNRYSGLDASAGLNKILNDYYDYLTTGSSSTSSS